MNADCADLFRRGVAGALLIGHGMEDTNVFFQDTVRRESWADEYERIFRLFEDNLKGARWSENPKWGRG